MSAAGIACRMRGLPRLRDARACLPVARRVGARRQGACIATQNERPPDRPPRPMSRPAPGAYEDSAAACRAARAAPRSVDAHLMTARLHLPTLRAIRGKGAARDSSHRANHRAGLRVGHARGHLRATARARVARARPRCRPRPRRRPRAATQGRRRATMLTLLSPLECRGDPHRQGRSGLGGSALLLPQRQRLRASPGPSGKSDGEAAASKEARFDRLK